MSYKYTNTPSSLEDGVLVVAINLEWFLVWTVRVNSVDSILSTSSLVGLSTKFSEDCRTCVCTYIQYISMME